MVSNKKLAVAGLAAWLITYVFAKTSKAARLRDVSLTRKQVTTWEGEGGNLLPGQPAPEHSAIH